MLKKLLSTRLARSAGVYTVANLVNSAIPFLLLPVLTRYLAPADFGVVSMFQVLVAVVGPFVGLSIHGAIGRQYFEKEKAELAQYIGTGFMILLASTLTVSLATWLFSEVLGRISAIGGGWLVLITPISFSLFVIQVALVIWQMQGEALRYSLFSICQTLCNAGLAVWFIAVAGRGWHGMVIAQAVTTTVFALIGVGNLLKDGWINFTWRREYASSALSFGLPLIPHALGAWAIDMIDRLFVTNFAGIAATGVYSVGYQIGKIIGILEASFIQAWVPYLYESLKKDSHEIKVRLVRFTYAYCLGLVAVALLLSFVAPWFMDIFIGREFAGAHRYVVWIALGYAANGMYKMMAGYVFYIQETSVLAKVTFATAVISVVATYLLTRAYGAMGAAYSTTLSFLFSFFVTWILSNRLYRMPWFAPEVFAWGREKN